MTSATSPAGDGGEAAPAVSIVIATYNWSAALKCALRSVLLQRFQDFEVLVVGDACTDDSAAVVASFADPRFRWINLERNHGSQWAPNNRGIAEARGDWIAYHGHDDVWHPDHLAAGLARAAATGADYVAATTVIYGPDGSDIRGLTGLNAGDGLTPVDFFPPSSVMHKRSVVERSGPWPPRDECDLPVDCAFQTAVARSGARFATTEQLTVFKFNSALRRDSYKTRHSHEQEAMLGRLERGEDTQMTELMAVMKSVLIGKYMPIEMPVAGPEAGSSHRRYRKIRGLGAWFAPDELITVARRHAFRLDGDMAPYEWHELETPKAGGSFRWSGPLNRSSVMLPVRFDRAFTVRIQVNAALEADWQRDFRLTINDVPVVPRFVAGRGGEVVIEAEAVPVAGDRAGAIKLVLEIARTVRPIDIGAGRDRRWMGIAVSTIQVSAREPERRFRRFWARLKPSAGPASDVHSPG